MTELADFLLARIAEDEAMARAAVEWQSPGSQPWSADGGSLVDGTGSTFAGYVGDDVAPHIARWEPTRVLAECEAKRRIVERYQRAQERLQADRRRVLAGGYPDAARSQVADWDESALRPILSLLALPYADHPDYQDEWRAR